MLSNINPIPVLELCNVNPNPPDLGEKPTSHVTLTLGTIESFLAHKEFILAEIFAIIGLQSLQDSFPDIKC